MPIMSQGSLRAAGAHDQVDRGARVYALSLGSSGRGVMGRATSTSEPYIEPLKHPLFHRLCLSDPASMCLRARAFLSRLAVSPSHRNERTLNLGSTSLISSLEKPSLRQYRFRTPAQYLRSPRKRSHWRPTGRRPQCMAGAYRRAIVRPATG